MDQEKLFIRRTTSTETKEGLQQSNINVFVYDSIELAWTYFSEIMNEEEWDKLITSGEGFYKVEGEGYDNYIFVEARKVSI
tara:strand:+ start:18412 stop:18654 length:243 start_codon:yes stop_codon:yes gene_type:complete